VPSLFIPDVPEYVSVREVIERQEGVTVRRHRTHVEFEFDHELVVDRAETGLRHALWYSCVGGLLDSRVEQFDKAALKVVAAHG